MIAGIRDSWYMAGRHLRNLSRQPIYIALTLFQPILYLVVFSQLFKKITLIPGFSTTSYLVFLTPGIIVLNALFGTAWSGMSMIEDLNRGVIDRFLQTPVKRVSLIAGRLTQMGVTLLIQSLILVALALIMGARFSGGAPGIVLLFFCSIMLALPFAAFSNGIALMSKQQETVAAAVNFILLPLMFLSTVFMAPNLVPGWIRAISRYNPVNWAVEAGRAAVSPNPNWAIIGIRLLLLAGLSVVGIFFATRAFKTYQRSV